LTAAKTDCRTEQNRPGHVTNRLPRRIQPRPAPEDKEATELGSIPPANHYGANRPGARTAFANTEQKGNTCQWHSDADTDARRVSRCPRRYRRARALIATPVFWETIKRRTPSPREAHPLEQERDAEAPERSDRQHCYVSALNATLSQRLVLALISRKKHMTVNPGRRAASFRVRFIHDLFTRRHCSLFARSHRARSAVARGT